MSTFHFSSTMTLERGRNETEYDVIVDWSYNAQTDEHHIDSAKFCDHEWPETVYELDQLHNDLIGMIEDYVSDYRDEYLAAQAEAKAELVWERTA